MTHIEDLLIAVITGNIHAVEHMLSNHKVVANAHLHTISDQEALINIPVGTTALMLAAKHARTQIIKLLLGLHDHAHNTQAYLDKYDIFAKNADEKNVFDFILDSTLSTEDMPQDLDQIAMHIIDFLKVKSITDLRFEPSAIQSIFTKAVNRGLYRFVVKLIDLGVQYSEFENIVSAAIASDSSEMVNLFVQGVKINSTRDSVTAEKSKISKSITIRADLETAINCANADVIKIVFNSLPVTEQLNFNKLDIIIAVLQRRTQIQDANGNQVYLSNAADHGYATELLREWFPRNSLATKNTDFSEVLFAAAASGAYDSFYNLLSMNYNQDFNILNHNGESLLDIAFENNGVNSIKPLHIRYKQTEMYKESNTSWFQLHADKVETGMFSFWFNNKALTCSLLAFSALNSDIELLQELWDLESYSFDTKYTQLKHVIYEDKTVLDLLQDLENNIDTKIVEFLKSKKIIHPLQQMNPLSQSGKTSTAPKRSPRWRERITNAFNMFGKCTCRDSDPKVVLVTTQTISSSVNDASSPRLPQRAVGSVSAKQTTNIVAPSDTTVIQADSPFNSLLGLRDFRSSSPPSYTPASISSTPFSVIGSRVNFMPSSEASSPNISRAQTPVVNTLTIDTLVPPPVRFTAKQSRTVHSETIKETPTTDVLNQPVISSNVLNIS